MSALAWLVLLGLGLLFWRDALRAREQAKAASLRLCHSHGLMLLDDTVALQRMWLGRGAGGRPRLCRTYGFEFSADGSDRRRGSVVLAGSEVTVMSLDDGDLYA